MRWLVVVAVLVSGCAHVAIQKVSDCDQVQGEERVECSACLVQNEAAGWLGTYEYRPKEKAGSRCVRVK
jgi:uncharacterized protein YceK